jgi:hypothetical protein
MHATHGVKHLEGNRGNCPAYRYDIDFDRRECASRRLPDAVAAVRNEPSILRVRRNTNPRLTYVRWSRGTKPTVDLALNPRRYGVMSATSRANDVVRTSWKQTDMIDSGRRGGSILSGK